jgi:outer membrane protein assembly factor BamB
MRRAESASRRPAAGRRAGGSASAYDRSMRRLTLLTMLVCAAGPAMAQGMFHGDPAHSGAYASPGPRQLGGVDWSFATGGPVVGSPVTADGVVYIASLSGFLYAIDQQTGKERWKFKSSRPIASTPAVANGTLYFVSSAGALAALDLATGQPKWVTAVEYEKHFEARNLHGYAPAGQTIPDAWDLYTSSPVVDHGRVYFGSGDGNVYAVDSATGVLQWKFPTRDVVHASPAVVNNTVYIGSWDGTFYAIDAESGVQRWAFKAGDDPATHNQVGFQSSAAVVDGTVYVGCRDAHVYALDAASGRKKWDFPTSKSWVNGTPAVRDGVVYVGTSDSARFLALDARTGRLRFSVDAKAYVFSSAAIAGDLVYFGTHNGRLYAIDAKSGRSVSEFRTEASKADPLKILQPDGALNAAAFTPVFGDFEDMYLDFYRFTSVGAIVSSPVVDRGVLYVGSTDGNLYALH